jgi:hypothetical protein
MQSGSFSIIESVKSKTLTHESLVNIEFSSLTDLVQMISNVHDRICSLVITGSVMESLSIQTEMCRSFNKDLCHTRFSEGNQVHTYKHAKIKFHAYSDI